MTLRNDEHDPGEAIDFLTWAYPQGPWCLTAVAVDQLGIDTRTFRPDLTRELCAFLALHHLRNIYWSVNLPIGDISKKAEKIGMAEAHFLHVDVDPHAHLDKTISVDDHLESERKHILARFEAPPDAIPRPSCVVFSGGGYQALYRLAEPFVIGGDLARAEELESYNRQLELAFGADHCHNVDRILRLPGSVNYPNAKKRAKGRRIERATVACWSPFGRGAAFSLEQFTRARPIQAPARAGLDEAVGTSSPTTPAVPGNLAKLASVRDLPDGVSEKIRMMIVQGRDPDDQGPVDRSRTVWAVACALVRANVPDATIASVLLDPDYGISEHVRAQDNPRKYTIRQIRRAKELAIDPQLEELNRTHAVVENIGGKCRVLEEQLDRRTTRWTLTFQSFEDFKNRYMHRRVRAGFDAKGNPIEIPLGKWWLEHQARLQYRAIAFAPGEEIDGVYNLWRGFAVEPRPGDKHKRFLDHLFENICSANTEHYDYLLSWMARAVQRPATQGEVAVVLRGKKGVGKSTAPRVFGALFGRHYWAVSNAHHIVGNFNGHLRDCVVLFGDEAFWAGDRKHESILKALITEDTIVVEKKGVDSEIAPNYIHLIMASNAEWVIPASQDERRYLVLDVRATKMQDKAYFGALNADLEAGGLSNLLHELQTRDISEFDHRTAPRTEALQDQKIHSLESHEEWFYRRLCDGQVLNVQASWEDPVQKSAVLDAYLEYAQRVGGRRAPASLFERFLERCCGGLETYAASGRVQNPEGDPVVGRVTWVKFPPLERCRAGFDAACGGPFKWPEIEFRREVREAF